MEFAATLEATAREMIEREAARLWPARDAEGEDPMCPVLWVLPTLVEMVVQDHERPVHEHTERIRQLITELEFLDDNGDNVVDAHLLARVEAQIEVAVRVLEQVRQQALSEGKWSLAPMPSLMCG